MEFLGVLPESASQFAGLLADKQNPALTSRQRNEKIMISR